MIRTATLEWFSSDAGMQKKVCYIHGSACTKDDGEWMGNEIFLIDCNYLLCNNEDEISEKYFVIKSICVY